MLVRLLHYTPLWVAGLAGGTCVDKGIIEEPIEAYLQKFVKKGHESVIEHIVYSFYIKNITRALLMELTRHRIASYSVLSTRWTFKKLMKKLQEIDKRYEPFTIEKKQALSKYFHFDEKTWEIQLAHVDDLLDAYEKGCSIDELKMLIPENLYTSLVMTINARSFRNLLNLRLDKNAFYQFRELSRNLLCVVPDDHKNALFFDIISKFSIDNCKKNIYDYSNMYEFDTKTSIKSGLILKEIEDGIYPVLGN